MLEESTVPALGEKRLEQEGVRQAGIQVLTVGFDRIKLEPIVNIMMETVN